MDNYIYSPDDEVIKGEIDPNKIYKENDFNINIRIKEREEKRVETFLSHIDQNEKTLVFCANQPHAALIRDIINQKKSVKDIDYCHRVTAKDGELGESYLKKFQDNENLIPTILTTSRKLSTGVNARNIRNIILLRPIRSMIEFKQIIGRGTRLFDGKEFFSIYDFVGAYNHFNDPDWDGEPIDPIIEPKPGKPVKQPPKEPRPERIDVKLADGKKRNIQVLMTTSYLDTNGNPISSEAYINQLFENLPVFFKNEDELRKIWSIPSTRIELLNNLENKGFNKGNLLEIQSILSKQDCDVYDVLNYIAFTSKTKTRKERTVIAKNKVDKLYDNNQLEFIEFLFKQYEINGVFELNLENLPDLISIKYGSFSDAATKLGEVNDIQDTFINFQKHLY